MMGLRDCYFPEHTIPDVVAETNLFLIIMFEHHKALRIENICYSREHIHTSGPLK